MRFEDLFEEVGGFGRFQLLMLLLLCFPRLILPMHFLLHNFLAAVPAHHCQLPDPGHQNLSQRDRLLQHIPQDSEGARSSCRIYIQPQLHLLSNSTFQANSSADVPCPRGWEYDYSQFTSTIVTEWDLVCEWRSLNQASSALFYVGVMFGSIIFGYLSDKFGRLPMLVVSLVSSSVLGMVTAFSTSFLMFAVMRSLCGVALTGIAIISITLCVEWIDLQHRTFAGIISSLAWSTGNILLALIAFSIRDWRWLLFSISAPCILFSALCWWIPESARWLLANGKTRLAQTYLTRCARMNRRKDFAPKISCEVLEAIHHPAPRAQHEKDRVLDKIITTDESCKQYSYWHLVKTPRMRRLTVCSGIVWFGTPFAYYGISLTITGFGLNMYLTQLVYGAIEVPAKLLSYLLLDRVGRRWCQAGFMILTGLLLLISIIIPTDLSIARSAIVILAKGFSEAAFTTAFLYTAEMYPTVVRQSGLGYTSFVGRLAASVAPVVKLLNEFWMHLPTVIFGTTIVLCGAIAFLLPETSNVRLPETIEDVEYQRHLAPTEPEAEEKPGISIEFLKLSEHSSCTT
uniref:Solute carrier family 22 member 7 n=1 Tax=Callorhinchus milii TaxID=7868 RepID=V9KP80_CALMI